MAKVFVCCNGVALKTKFKTFKNIFLAFWGDLEGQICYARNPKSQVLYQIKFLNLPFSIPDCKTFNNKKNFHKNTSYKTVTWHQKRTPVSIGSWSLLQISKNIKNSKNNSRTNKSRKKYSFLINKIFIHIRFIFS